MDNWLNNPTFVVYAITSLALTFNLVFLWMYSAAVRGKTKTALNPEDAKQFGSTLEPTDPPEVARVLRAHSNAQAMIYPFLILGLVYVLAGGAPGFAKIVFGIFVAARFTHSAIYLAGKQPWRTASFLVSLLTLLTLLGDVVWLVIQGPVRP